MLEVKVVTSLTSLTFFYITILIINYITLHNQCYLNTTGYFYLLRLLFFTTIYDTK